MQSQTIITAHDVDELFIFYGDSTDPTARLSEPPEYYCQNPLSRYQRVR